MSSHENMGMLRSNRVSGFHFLAFDNGATIFFRPGLDVIVARVQG